MKLLRSNTLKQGRDGLLELLAALGGRDELKEVFDEVREAADQSPEIQTHLLIALEQAADQRGVRPTGDLNKIEALLKSESDSVRASAARLAGRWRLESLRAPLTELAQRKKTSESVRRGAIDGLVLLGGPRTQEVLEQLAGSSQPDSNRRLAILALASLDLNRAAQNAVDWLKSAKADADPAEIVAAFLERKNGDTILAEALAKTKLRPDVAKLAVRAVRTSSRPAPALLEALNRAGGLSQVRHILSADELQVMSSDVLKRGDPARGEALFRRSDLACLKCHAIGGAGGQVGPDLTSIGASAPVDYLVVSILLPNKAVKEGYHALVVSSKDGRFFTGIKIRETNTDLILRTAEDREQAIPVKDIEDRSPGGSLMPEGLVDNLTRAELVDLVRFLSELGKVGSYAIGQARVVRRWQVLDATPEAVESLRATRALEYSNQGAAANGIFKNPSLTWSSTYSQVNGLLPVESMPRLRVSEFTPPRAYPRFQLEASAGGPVKLLLNSATGLSICWLDREPIRCGEKITLDLKPGMHTVTFSIDLDQRKDGLRCELEDIPSSSARVRIVAGK